MARLENLAAGWLADHGDPGERLVSWMKLGVPSKQGGNPASSMDRHVEERGLDPDQQAAVGHAQMFALLTDRRLLLVAVGGVLRVKLEELLVDAPIADCHVEWTDTRLGLGQHERHLLMVLGDRWVRTSGVANDRANADGFITALGPGATAARV